MRASARVCCIRARAMQVRASSGRAQEAHGNGVEITILGVSGSLRKASYNTGLLRAASNYIPSGCKLEIADISTLPLFNDDLTRDEPPRVTEWREQVRRADCLLFASPEHNFNVTAAMKNCIDWVSKNPNEWNNKPVAVMGAGGGSGGLLSSNALRQSGVFLNLRFLNKPQVQVKIGDKPPPFNPETGDLDEQSSWQPKIKDLVHELATWTLLLKQMETKY